MSSENAADGSSTLRTSATHTHTAELKAQIALRDLTFPSSPYPHSALLELKYKLKIFNGF